MDLNWNSPWEEDVTTSSDLPAAIFKPPISQHSRDNHDSSWSIIDNGGSEWASHVQNDWAFDDGKPQRERRLSETLGWGTSDDQHISSLRPLSLQLPPRASSPDPWAAVVVENEKAQIQDNSRTEPQQKEIADDIPSVLEGGDQDSSSTGEEGNDVLEGAQLGGDFDATKPDIQNSPQQAVELLVEEVTHCQQIQNDSASSRPSSLHSHHADNLTADSSRTSFEQESEEDPSKVQKLVQHFDDLATEIKETPELRTGSLSQSKSIDTIRQTNDSPEEGSDIDDFGDFEEETSGLKFQASEEPRTNGTGKVTGLTFSLDPKLLDTLLSEICPDYVVSKNRHDAVNQQTSNDIFTTIEERKTWHRISRYGTMRKHDTGNDENYRRVKWQNSKIRDETIKIVSRWRNGDGLDGGIVRGGGDGGSMFGWDDRGKRNSGPINMSAIWAEKALKASRHRSMPSPLSSKATPKSPPALLKQEHVPESKTPSEEAPRFGWSTEDKAATVVSQKSPATPPSSPFSLRPPPKFSAFSLPPSPAQSSPRPTSMDINRHPRIASLKGLGHRSTVSLDGQIHRPISLPLNAPAKPVLPVPAVEKPLPPVPPMSCIQGIEEDDDDWGDMVSSTPDLDAAFQIPDESPREVRGSRNRADSTPHPAPNPSALDRVPQSKRPISLHFGAPPSSSIFDLASLVSLSDKSPGKEQQPPMTAPLVPAPRSEILSPPVNAAPAIPKLSNMTDDFDPWGSIPTQAFSAAERTVEVPAKNSTSSKLAPELLEVTPDDFDTWASFDALPSHTRKNDGHTAPSTATDPKSFLPWKTNFSQLTTTTANKMDGWSNADFSIFETAVPAKAPATTRKEPQKQATKHSEAAQKERPKLDNTSSAQQQTHKNLEEERIVKSITGKLPDLRYMFR